MQSARRLDIPFLTNERMTQMTEVKTNLMRAPGKDCRLDQTKVFITPQQLEFTVSYFSLGMNS